MINSLAHTHAAHRLGTLSVSRGWHVEQPLPAFPHHHWVGGRIRALTFICKFKFLGLVPAPSRLPRRALAAAEGRLFVAFWDGRSPAFRVREPASAQ
jgi:hypothetical protein